MTEIDVHFNVEDKLHHACRLLRKAVLRSGVRLVVTADASTLDALDIGLWQMTPNAFVAHCWVNAETELVRRSPVLLAPNSAQTVLPHHEVLVNLCAELPVGFERFERLIDLVGADPQDRQAGRSRWKHYVDRGYVIRKHDAAGLAAPA